MQEDVGANSSELRTLLLPSCHSHTPGLSPLSFPILSSPAHTSTARIQDVEPNIRHHHRRRSALPSSLPPLARSPLTFIHTPTPTHRRRRRPRPRLPPRLRLSRPKHPRHRVRPPNDQRRPAAHAARALLPPPPPGQPHDPLPRRAPERGVAGPRAGRAVRTVRGRRVECEL